MEYDRNDLIILAAIEYLEDGRDPFDFAFIADHNLSDVEVIMLAKSLARGLEILMTQYECAYDKMLQREVNDETST